MRTILLALAFGAIGVTMVHARNPEILALTRKLDCTSYRLTKTSQRIRLSPQNAIPGATRAWVVLNEGPSAAVVFVDNGDRLPLAVFDGHVSIIAGDDRYSYKVGLRKGGTTLIHVCR